MFIQRGRSLRLGEAVSKHRTKNLNDPADSPAIGSNNGDLGFSGADRTDLIDPASEFSALGTSGIDSDLIGPASEFSDPGTSGIGSDLIDPASEFSALGTSGIGSDLIDPASEFSDPGTSG